MANSCAGLDPTWAHLPATAPTHTPHAAAGHCHSTTTSSSWLFPAAAFENEALTSALRASMAPAHHAAAASPHPDTPSSSSTSSASELLSGGSHDASALAASSRPAPPARAGPNKAGGRITKRKPRQSRRPPPTYITADPANFRRLVQEVTGFPGPGPYYSGVPQAAAEGASTAPSYAYTAAPASVLPTLDTSAFLLDQAAPAAAAMVREEKSSSGGASSVTAITATAASLGRQEKISSGGVSSAMAVTAAPAVDEEDSSVLQELEAMACAQEFLCDDFPTLESWGIII